MTLQIVSLYVLKLYYLSNYHKMAVNYNGQGSLTEGKAQFGWPPCTNQFASAPFYIENIINLFYKTSYLNEEVNCTEPFLVVSILCEHGPT